MSLATLIRTKRNQLSTKLEGCIRDYFDLALFKSRLEDGVLSSAHRLESTEIWQAFSGMSDTAFELCQMITQILYMATLSHTRGPVLLIICTLRPIVSLLYMERDYWSRPILAYIDNNDYFRKTALDRLTGPGFIDEIITSNSAAYFIRQYEECIKKLKGIPLRRFYESQGMNQTSWAVITETLSELPMVRELQDVADGHTLTLFGMVEALRCLQCRQK
ncbi:hypothetical protein BDP27DRAFT_201993 [Rhodocollybia butyracea]|uniref:Uncharacterized protein n=1 Tax=Rhodocollybia butyracea TaxID=206335 RepID=A0A9P5PIL2_9AGAR|nr:hypothetical protein BDP27DRAFT_201993 [Rhodocollybia butyracea]